MSIVRRSSGECDCRAPLVSKYRNRVFWSKVRPGSAPDEADEVHQPCKYGCHAVQVTEASSHRFCDAAAATLVAICTGHCPPSELLVLALQRSNSHTYLDVVGKLSSVYSSQMPFVC